MSDGSGSSNYQNNANCKWILAPGAGFQVTITFSEFSTEGGYDSLKLWECAEADCVGVTQLASLSGDYPPSLSYTSTTGYMLIVFTSDASVAASGWSASWTSSVSAIHQCIPCNIGFLAQ
jgi:hypothetical protein